MNESDSTDAPDSLSPQVIHTQMQPKAVIDFTDPITNFFYYQSHVICRCQKKVLIYSTITKKTDIIQVETEDYVLEQLPPYLVVIIEGQYMRMYGEEEGKEVKAKISKMEPVTICRYNKGCFLGGYNRSILPGGKRSTRRAIYYIDKLIFTSKNTPTDIIKLKESTFPVSHLRIQNPYLLAYCQPVLYLISIFTREILLTFQKEAVNLLVLEGRYATSCLNGLGISLKKTIFTFDVERFPLYGVEINEHLQECQCVCMERTGRIFGGKGNQVFQYDPIKRHIRSWTTYPENERVLWISCTPNNNLMVLHSGKGNIIDVYSLD